MYIDNKSIVFLKIILYYKYTGANMKKKGNNFFKIEMLILAYLSQNDMYGYEIVKAVTNGTNEVVTLKEGTMYPILYKLLEQKYISSYDKIINKKIRVYYHLEEKGYAYLIELKDIYFNAVENIAKALKKGEINE